MSDIESIPLLSIRVIKSSLSVDNSALLEEITKYSRDIDKQFLENEYSTRYTYYEDKAYPFGHKECDNFIKAVESKVSSILNREMKVTDIWSLTLEKGQSIAAHSHKLNTHLYPEEYFSISYYPQADEDSADLIFMVNACNTLETNVPIKVKTGDLLIFNSYLMHMTNRHTGDRERIVISANLAPTSPTTSVAQDWTVHSVDKNASA